MEMKSEDPEDTQVAAPPRAKFLHRNAGFLAGCGKRLLMSRLAGETGCPTTRIQAHADHGGIGIHPVGAFFRCLLAVLFLLAANLSSQPSPREQPGPLPGGGFLLNSGWRITPAGAQIPLDTLPMSTALSRDGKYLLALNAGLNPPSISVIDTASAQVVNRAPVPDAWLGLTFSPAGDRVYVGGGSRAAVFEFSFSNGALTAARTFAVVPQAQRAPQDFIGDVALSPDGRLLYAAELYRDAVLVINPQSGMMIGRYKTGRRPYRILFQPDGKSFFVTHWADGTLGHYDVASGSLLSTVRLGPHPTDMVWRNGASEGAEGESSWTARLFVAAANTNSIYAIGVSASNRLTMVENINIAMTPRQPLGMTPSGLGLSQDGNLLYAACSGANAVAVLDVSAERSIVKGFIPTGWYPTAARALSSGALVVLNGRGNGSHPNLNGAPPANRGNAGESAGPNRELVAHIEASSASWIAPFHDNQLDEWTRTVLANSPYRDEKLDAPSALPPIQHVVYIVKQGRTYDQVLGDVKEGNGDGSLAQFGENVTPNHHKLAREFALLDNFYVNGDVAADGHNWSTAAIAPDYTEKIWPNYYAGRRGGRYDFEGGEPANTPPAGYLWTNAAAAGLSIRNFGYFVENKPSPPPGAEQVAAVRDPVLAPVTNRFYRGFDLDFPDVERAKVFVAELAEHEKSGQMPRLVLMLLGDDRGSGLAPGKIAPLSAEADNDYALGLIVEALSKSRFWSSTAIFVLESDAQNGQDHVDSHRSLAFVISPYVKRHSVDNSMYNTTSALRTIELLLGLRPMTHFDAGARPFSALFQTTPDTSAYTAETPRITLDRRNAAMAPVPGASRPTGGTGLQAGPDRPSGLSHSKVEPRSGFLPARPLFGAPLPGSLWSFTR
jgi:DNA-binding beta-propeller fold protein YncE